MRREFLQWFFEWSRLVSKYVSSIFHILSSKTILTTNRIKMLQWHSLINIFLPCVHLMSFIWFLDKCTIDSVILKFIFKTSFVFNLNHNDLFFKIYSFYKTLFLPDIFPWLKKSQSLQFLFLNFLDDCISVLKKKSFQLLLIPNTYLFEFTYEGYFH
jgi:hypothetical protein